MSAVVLQKKIVLDAKGDPVEVIIPYKQFVQFFEAYGFDLTQEDENDIREAEQDRKNGNATAFISLEKLEEELGCTE